MIDGSGIPLFAAPEDREIHSLHDLRRLRRQWRRRRKLHQTLHKLRALKVRICFRLGAPSLLPEVPEDDREGLERLRHALAEMWPQEDQPRVAKEWPTPYSPSTRHGGT